MRAIWTGAIGFGLVNIPVKLFSGSQESSLDLDMLDKKDHSRIHYQRVNEDTGKVIEWKNIVKGYKLNGDYVILDDEDFKKASPEKTKTVHIEAFIDEAEIETVYYEVPYYLEPTKGGERAYVLLRDALKKSGKVGVGSFVLRSKEQLCVIKPYENILLLEKIRFAEEIRKTSELKVPKAKAKATEMKMALSLINQLTTEFDITEYKDTYTAALMKFIKAKAKGGKVKEPVMKVTHRKPMDLMEQLKASMGKKAS
ncbi:Ku protein [Chryseolinea sp. T2]|uniref:non-homologous end joining protein Ku n=1 Tax=Chryseolinea sp. T2 TaxID=3129255 RepID=UPI003076B70B